MSGFRRVGPRTETRSKIGQWLKKQEEKKRSNWILLDSAGFLGFFTWTQPGLNLDWAWIQPGLKLGAGKSKPERMGQDFQGWRKNS